MSRAELFISTTDLAELLRVLGNEGQLYITTRPVASEPPDLHYRPYSTQSTPEFAYGDIRPVEPLKSFLLEVRERLLEYPGTEPAAEKPPAKQIIVGLKQCDIESLKTYDSVFTQGEFKDDSYVAKRQATTLISGDCPKPADFCFCTMLGGRPYCTEGFDLNMSQVEGGYVIEVGSDKGEKIVSASKSLFKPASAGQLDERSASRKKATDALNIINKEYELKKTRQQILAAKEPSAAWPEQLGYCVEDGACLFACPTCYCFLLYDQQGKLKGKYERARSWDVCMYAGYSRMAGGGTPRPRLVDRFRHRFMHKFSYFHDNYKLESCSGCGRCFVGCGANIDVRKVFKALDE